MPRIFKGSESTLRLLISKTGDYQALTEIKIKLYTTDIENAIEIIDGIQVCKNIATVTLAPRAFMGMEDGLINYIIDGATEDDVFHTERQSNYMLKSLSYINEDGVASQTMTIESNGEYRVTPNDGLYVSINVNVPDLNGSYDEGFNVGYGQGKTDGVNEQKGKLSQITISENGTYTKEDGYNQIEVNVPDLNGSYDEGYGQGKTDGVNEQKSKLETISITENGTYTKEDGYNHIEVNVPDLNGSYNEGYGQGKTDGINEQKSKLETINITENGTYSKEDGYNHIEVNVPDLNGSYDEGKIDGINEQKSKLETISITENGTYTKEDGYNHIEVNVPDLNGSYDEGYGQGKTDGVNEQKSKLESISITENGVYSKEDGYNHIEVNVPDLNGSYDEGYNQGQADAAANARVLDVTKNGQYGDGKTLYKTINVNVVPKVNIQEAGINFAYSTFTEVPEWADFNGTTSMYNMFSECRNLQTIPMIDTSNVTDMNYMFQYCSKLQTIPLLNTSNVTSMRSMFDGCRNLQTIPQLDTSNVTNMFSIFMDCYNLQTIPQIDTSNANSISKMFYGCNNLRTLPELDASNTREISDYFGGSTMSYLTDVGGWKNLKCRWNDGYGLNRCPNLTYQSCINVLNGLYDFTGNGETPNNSQGKLKVHQNFLTTVGDEISIGTNKGWTITA